MPEARGKGRSELEAEVSPELAPPRRLPAIHFQVLRIQRGNRHSRIGAQRLVGCRVIRANLESAVAPVGRAGQAIDLEAQEWQDFIVDDVLEEHGIWVERVFRQDDAVVESLVVLDGSASAKTSIQLIHTGPNAL